MGLIPGLGRSPGGGSGNSLKYSDLKNPMDRGAWQGSKESGMTEQLSTHAHKLRSREEEGCAECVAQR